jgi:hypothetical protein
MNQRGFILPSPTMIMVGAIGVLVLLLCLQTWRLDAIQTEYATFASGVEQVGKLAAAAAEKKEADDKLAKEKADHENVITHAKLADTIKRLRAQRASSGFLPPAAPGAGSPQRACFERDDLERALRTLDRGVQELVAEGDEVTVNLSSAKRWAQDVGGK